MTTCLRRWGTPTQIRERVAQSPYGASRSNHGIPLTGELAADPCCTRIPPIFRSDGRPPNLLRTHRPKRLRSVRPGRIARRPALLPILGKLVDVPLDWRILKQNPRQATHRAGTASPWRPSPVAWSWPSADHPARKACDSRPPPGIFSHGLLTGEFSSPVYDCEERSTPK